MASSPPRLGLSLARASRTWFLLVDVPSHAVLRGVASAFPLVLPRFGCPSRHWSLPPSSCLVLPLEDILLLPKAELILEVQLTL